MAAVQAALAAQSDWDTLRRVRGTIAPRRETQGADAAAAAAEEARSRVRALVPQAKLAAHDGIFEVPEWAGMPARGTHFAVYKRGEQVGTVMLDSSPYYLFGRHEAVCDIHLEHPSISRVHCAIVHHANGDVYACDLGAAHGTFVEGQRLAPRAPALLAEGAALRLGASSRLLRLRCSAPRSKRRRLAEGSPLEAPPARSPPAASPLQRRTPVRESVTSDAQRAAARAAAAAPAAEPQGGFWAEAPAEAGAAPAAASSPGAELPPRVSHILVKHLGSARPFERDGEETTRTADEAAALCRDIRRNILLSSAGAGVAAAFGREARRHSACETAARRGLVGRLRPGTMVAAFEEAALALGAGEMSDPVATPLGVHLIYRHGD